MNRYKVTSHGRTVEVHQPALLAEDLVLVQEIAPARELEVRAAPAREPDQLQIF